jgi:hypothetical protein
MPAGCEAGASCAQFATSAAHLTRREAAPAPSCRGEVAIRASIADAAGGGDDRRHTGATGVEEVALDKSVDDEVGGNRGRAFGDIGGIAVESNPTSSPIAVSAHEVAFLVPDSAAARYEPAAASLPSIGNF